MSLFLGKRLEVSNDSVLLGIVLRKDDCEAATVGSGLQHSRSAHIDHRTAVHSKILETAGVRLRGRLGIPPHQPQSVVIHGLVRKGGEGDLPAGVVGEVSHGGEHIHWDGILGDVALGSEIVHHLVICTCFRINGF